MSGSDIAFIDMHQAFAKAWTEYRITDDEIRLQHHEDVTDIIQVNKYLQSFTPQELTNKKSGWRWIARIPMSLDAQMLRDGVYKSKAAFNRWKNDNDNQAFVLCRDRRVATTPAGVQVITKQRRDT